MAAKRRAAGRGRGASRGNRGTPAWMWLLTGVLIGLGLAWYLFGKGYIPQPRTESESPQEAAETGQSAGSDEVAPKTGETKKSRYDFFTVLPEMEVVVPEQELAGKAQPDSPASALAPAGATYLLQVGSFRELADAEKLKAELALLGVVARVQSVTVNDATWHRVRVGPVQSAREADDMRSHLAANGIDSLVMKDQ